MSCSIFSACCLKPCVMKNAVDPTTAPKAVRGLSVLRENHTTDESTMETIA